MLGAALMCFGHPSTSFSTFLSSPRIILFLSFIFPPGSLPQVHSYTNVYPIVSNNSHTHCSCPASVTIAPVLPLSSCKPRWSTASTSVFSPPILDSLKDSWLLPPCPERSLVDKRPDPPNEQNQKITHWAYWTLSSPWWSGQFLLGTLPLPCLLQTLFGSPPPSLFSITGSLPSAPSTMMLTRLPKTSFRCSFPCETFPMSLCLLPQIRTLLISPPFHHPCNLSIEHSHSVPVIFKPAWLLGILLPKIRTQSFVSVFPLQSTVFGT